MKIDTGNHVVALDNVIGKTKLFYTRMKTGSASKFLISHIIRKSFSIDGTNPLSMQPAIEASNVMLLSATQIARGLLPYFELKLQFSFN